MDVIHSKLDRNNYRLTDQRKAILDVMLENQGSHLSAEEVLWEAKKKFPNIGIATVYRTLEKLANLDILHKSMFEGNKFRYELAEDDKHHHHHVVCLNCGQISEVSGDLLHELESKLEQQGYKIIDHELKFYGYCPACK
ncbi:MAG: Fur family transcriptional regulator [Syntrophomonadaceae bacterium]|jgi:Fur family ferric uptake transcriptional regulator|nr:transcriptional repressor [Syntrophomonadaceae bacterium]